jgi:hypothetical protein
MSFSNTDNMIGSRDVIKRIEELRGELDELIEAYKDAKDALADAKAKRDLQSTFDALVVWMGARYVNKDEGESFAKAVLEGASLKDWATSDDSKELFTLESLADEVSDFAADWEHGETLIRESYFVEYCKELLYDCGDISHDIPDYIVIDWEATAENLKADYAEVDFCGETYLIR